MMKIWNLFKSHLFSLSPTLEGELDKGAALVDLHKIEIEIGFSLDQAHKEILLINNGQFNRWDLPIFGPRNFLSCEMIIWKWRTAKSVALNLMEVEGVDIIPNPPVGVKGLGWSDGWIPFSASDDDFLFIDMDPADGGSPGQVVCSYRSFPDVVFAENITEYLERYVRLLREGDYEVDGAEVCIPHHNTWL